jgi:hypothetical protein
MKKLKIALAAVALTVVAGGAFANQAKQTADTCTPQQIERCNGVFDVCCETQNGFLQEPLPGN